MAQQRKLQLIRGERHLFSSSDDEVMMKQITATHAPDGRDVDARPLLQIIEDIFRLAKPILLVTSTPTLDAIDEKATHGALQGMLEAVALFVHRISCEMTCKCTGGRSDAHSTALAVFQDLTVFSWDAKLVLALAAFAVSYGEFWLAAQLHTNPLAKSLVLLKQLPDILEQSDVLKPRFDAINALIKEMLNVANSIIELKELPTGYITSDDPAMKMATAHIPSATYWTVRGIVACVSQMISLIGLGREHIGFTSETWDLSSLAHKLSNINGHLRKQLGLCYQYIEEKRDIEAFQNLVKLFEIIHLDNMRIIKALFHSPDDLPLIDGLSRKKVDVEVLRRKSVILFISDLEISHEELTVLIRIYKDAKHGMYERQYETVWLPIVERGVELTNQKLEQFSSLSSMMPWYSVHHPSVLQPHVVRYIKEVWKFDKKPLLVVLDAQGKVVSPNALYMMWIWGWRAFPFTASREEELWRAESSWKIDFLVDDIDPLVVEWANNGKYICLYGGEDLDWIRSFISAMKKVMQETGISIEMVYVGKSHPKERVRKNIGIIHENNLSKTWHDLVDIWYFWSRLESMWYSKIHKGRRIDDDEVMQEVMTMLTYDGTNAGWAVISQGLTEMVRSEGKSLVECLSLIDAWKMNVDREGFIPALRNALLAAHKHEHCVSLILPGIDGKITEKVVCAECKRPMEKFILYRCCND